ncbi:GNAT family N-acetyltransferase [Myceligenerans indicum]|uniref:N-acetyltransferase n=1 Tax=Myceligenerans indicum TaxID=2593663 RepID=A0ABS1LIM6_9MICO|nr:GNAT family N-acetyltransferase [Myceligenerans indicum]MBL0885422.1 N-acetyltransferase [Myceligenerans indicum]
MSSLYAPPAAVRPARADDAGAVRAIRNDAVETTTAIWTSVPMSEDEARSWVSDLAGRNAMLVAEVDGDVVGYASFSPWRAKEGYRHSVEDSVYVAPGQQGNGVGRALLTELVATARDAGAHRMYADIEAGNAASISLHESLGFRRVGLLREVGTKFGRWLDLAILELELA